ILVVVGGQLAFDLLVLAAGGDGQGRDRQQRHQYHCPDAYHDAILLECEIAQLRYCQDDPEATHERGIGRRRTMKYAVIGAAGQLGQDLQSMLGVDAIPLTRQEADLTRPEMVRAALTSLRPQAVFNCAAYNLVDRAEAEPEAAFAVNVWGVRTLAEVCRDL